MDKKKSVPRGKSPKATEDPYVNDDDKYQEHFRKTFITENQKMVEDIGESFSVHDMMIPAGRMAKLVRVSDITDDGFRVAEVCNRLKLNEPTPVIILAGAMTERAGKTLAGVARAAGRTDAVIIDSGVGSGIEKFCMRRKSTFIGVAPENEIKYPRINFQGSK